MIGNLFGATATNRDTGAPGLEDFPADEGDQDEDAEKGRVGRLGIDGDPGQEGRQIIRFIRHQEGVELSGPGGRVRWRERSVRFELLGSDLVCLTE